MTTTRLTWFTLKKDAKYDAPQRPANNWNDICGDHKPRRCQLESSESGVKHHNIECDKQKHKLIVSLETAMIVETTLDLDARRHRAQSTLPFTIRRGPRSDMEFDQHISRGAESTKNSHQHLRCLTAPHIHHTNKPISENHLSMLIGVGLGGNKSYMSKFHKTHFITSLLLVNWPQNPKCPVQSFSVTTHHAPISVHQNQGDGMYFPQAAFKQDL